MDFPTFTKDLSGNNQYSPTTIINRTQMDMGPPKQSPNQAYSFPQVQKQLLFTVAQWRAFLTWYKDPTQGNYGAVFFDWTDVLVSDSTIQARIVNGDYQTNPINATTTHVIMKTTFEYHD